MEDNNLFYRYFARTNLIDSKKCGKKIKYKYISLKKKKVRTVAIKNLSYYLFHQIKTENYLK